MSSSRAHSRERRACRINLRARRHLTGKGCVIARKETNGKIEIADAEMHLSSVVLVERLVARGFSRLSAERFVEIERGAGEAGRARPHPVARR
jgi:hypothetical protein